MVETPSFKYADSNTRLWSLLNEKIPQIVKSLIDQADTLRADDNPIHVPKTAWASGMIDTAGLVVDCLYGKEVYKSYMERHFEPRREDSFLK